MIAGDSWDDNQSTRRCRKWQSLLDINSSHSYIEQHKVRRQVQGELKHMSPAKMLPFGQELTSHRCRVMEAIFGKIERTSVRTL